MGVTPDPRGDVVPGEVRNPPPDRRDPAPYISKFFFFDPKKASRLTRPIHVLKLYSSGLASLEGPVTGGLSFSRQKKLTFDPLLGAQGELRGASGPRKLRSVDHAPGRGPPWISDIFFFGTKEGRWGTPPIHVPIVVSPGLPRRIVPETF